MATTAHVNKDSSSGSYKGNDIDRMSGSSIHGPVTITHDKVSITPKVSHSMYNGGNHQIGYGANVDYKATDNLNIHGGFHRHGGHNSGTVGFGFRF